jgi:D-alanine-D-alanine ligase
MRIALIFGGRSGEHAVSVVSARSVAQALHGHGHTVIPMAIDRRGLWADGALSLRILEETGDRTDEVCEFSGTLRFDPRLIEDDFDVVFPVLHGPYGEDGTIQGLLEMLDLPYVGCGVAASALCMDKARSKTLVAAAGFSTAPWVTVERHRWLSDPATLKKKVIDLGLPLFVKPSRMGSSVGITKVTDISNLDTALGTAFAHDSSVVIERGIDAREIEIAVLGNDEPLASVPGEVVPGTDFYSFEDKYIDDGCQLLAPAPLDEVLTEKVQSMALSIYEELGCRGMARVDLFLGKTTGKLWFNEVNTIPGFTSISMFPRLWDLSGIPYPDLLDQLMSLALSVHSTSENDES